jgi:hypothetical protein
VACTSPAAFAGLARGAHTVVVSATGPGGTGSDSATWSVLGPPPTVTIAPRPTNTTSTAASVAFTTTGTVTATTCTVDGQPAVTCTSPKVLGGLVVGLHSITVTVTGPDGVGTDSATWIVNAPTAAPTITITGAPANPTTATTGTVTWTTTGTITTTTCALDGAAAAPCTSPRNLSGLTVRAHSLVVTVTNAGGTANATATWVQNAVPVAPPAATTLPSIVGAPRSGASGPTLTLNDGVWTGLPTFTRQWQRCTTNTDPTTCSDIAGATATTYHAVAADIDLYLRVVYTATNGGGSTVVASACAAKTQPS